jgi:hypothetical protein
VGATLSLQVDDDADVDGRLTVTGDPRRGFESDLEIMEVLYTVLEGSLCRHRQLHLSGTLAVTGPLAGQRRRRSSPWSYQRRRAQEPLASQATLRSGTLDVASDHGVKRYEAEQ